MPVDPALTGANASFIGANPPINNQTDPVLRQAVKDFQKLMNRTYEVLRKERVPDDQGGFTEELVPVLKVKGRLSSAGGRAEGFDAGQWVNHVDYVLFVPAPQDIRRQDEIRDGNGFSLRVLEVKEPSQAAFHLQVGCEETQKGR